ANLNTRTPVPSNGTPTVAATDARGTNAQITFGRTSGFSELKTVVEVSTDNTFATSQKLVLGPGSESFRLFGLTPQTNYFVRATFKNFEGDVTTPVGT